jgi:hypothetical protein
MLRNGGSKFWTGGRRSRGYDKKNLIKEEREYA